MFTKAKEMLNSISNAFSAVKQSAKDFGAKISTAASDFAGWCQRKIRVWKAPGVNPHMFRSGSEIAELSLSSTRKKTSANIEALRKFVVEDGPKIKSDEELELDRVTEEALAKFKPRGRIELSVSPQKSAAESVTLSSKPMQGLASVLNMKTNTELKMPQTTKSPVGFSYKRSNIGMCIGLVGKVAAHKEEQDREQHLRNFMNMVPSPF